MNKTNKKTNKLVANMNAFAYVMHFHFRNGICVVNRCNEWTIEILKGEYWCENPISLPILSINWWKSGKEWDIEKKNIIGLIAFEFGLDSFISFSNSSGSNACIYCKNLLLCCWWCWFYIERGAYNVSMP